MAGVQNGRLNRLLLNVCSLELNAPKRDRVSLLLRTFQRLSIQAGSEYKLSAVCHFFFSDASLFICLNTLHQDSAATRLTHSTR